jgi:hypothetical protein
MRAISAESAGRAGRTDASAVPVRRGSDEAGSTWAA